MQNLEKEKSDFFDNGYVIFNINDDLLINSVNHDVENLINTKFYKTNSAIYSYNEHPRIVESYKFSENCKKLALHNSVFDRLKYFYDFEPKAFSTINFLHSTQQPLHSDYVHFGTIPHRMLVGAWVALEDISTDSGPLQIVPKSHKLDLFDFEDVKAVKPKNIKTVKSNYELYEKFVLMMVKLYGLEPIIPVLKKGDCILWEANLLHGSPECKDSHLSRKSQVTHWTFDNVTKHFNPSFSSLRKNIFIERRITFIN